MRGIARSWSSPLMRQVWSTHYALGKGRGIGLDVGEGDVGVDQAADVDLAVGADEGSDVVGDVPDVDVHAGDDHALEEPERDELQGLRVTAVDDLVVAARLGQARAFHAELILV